MAKKQRRNFTREFKLEALRLAQQEGMSAAAAAKQLGIGADAIYRWRRQLANDPQAAFPGNGKRKTDDEKVARLERENAKLKAQIQFLKKSRRLLRQRKELIFEQIREHREEYPVTWMCEAIGVSSSGYYAWLGRTPSLRAKEDQRLLPRIRARFVASQRTYGSPRITRDLREEEEETCSRHRVARIMQENHIVATQLRRFRKTTDSDHDYPVAANLLDRDFEVAQPDRVWLADITHIRTEEGWLYLAIVLDLFSRLIVGWAADNRIDRFLALIALRRALRLRRPEPGLIHHSDRGSVYASYDYQKELKGAQVVCSMSRKGDCWDNAPMESFFGTLKQELVHRRKYWSREEAIEDLEQYLTFYNHVRRHTSLGGISPVEYEKRMRNLS